MSAEDDEQIVVVESSIEEEVECWENERYLGTWTSNLLPTDRYQQSDITGTVELPMKAYPMPAGWAWLDAAWRVDKPKNADKDGWFYAVDFSSPPDAWHAESGFWCVSLHLSPTITDQADARLAHPHCIS